MQSPAQRFFFVVPDDTHTHGGTTFIYRYVSVLAAGGVSAFVMQSSPTHRYPGIEGDVPVVYSDVLRRRLRRWMPRHRVAADVARRLVQGWANSAAAKADLLPGDVLVVPDVFINPVTEAFPNQRIVLLNQSYGILIDQLAAARGSKADPLTRCVAGVATSDASARVLDVLGVRPVHRLPLWIDRSLFAFSGAKKRQIAYMPRRLAEDSRKVMELLRRTTDLRGFEIVPIEGRTWKEVADILRESLIFLAFQRDEGFGLPPAEAMACGCIVVGYVGQGAAEYFDHTTGVVVPDGDVIAFADAVAKVIAMYCKDPRNLDDLRRAASERVARQYDRERGESRVVEVWRNIEIELAGVSQGGGQAAGSYARVGLDGQKLSSKIQS